MVWRSIEKIKKMAITVFWGDLEGAVTFEFAVSTNEILRIVTTDQSEA